MSKEKLDALSLQKRGHDYKGKVFVISRDATFLLKKGNFSGQRQSKGHSVVFSFTEICIDDSAITIKIR